MLGFEPVPPQCFKVTSREQTTVAELEDAVDCYQSADSAA